ncbi:MAG: bifunctional glutamate N-acetyltransferase/amino-acid acetyltransferase ArgJ [Bryobacteraceae bacterium]
MKLPLGFRYAATYAGIRKVAKDDLALIVSDTPASSAAVFTQNQVVAAPVTLARKSIKATRGKSRGWLINAGNANCATRTGDQVAATCTVAASKALGTKPAEILPASTGVIGVEMDAKKVVKALPKLVSLLAADQFDTVAHAIMTTDTRVKTAFAQINGEVSIAGMAKGSGMIQPNMATTLGFVTTDAVVTPAELQTVLRNAIENTFNCLTVDGDTSTNDTVAVLANGASGVRVSMLALEMALTKVLESLAKQIAADGEGARKLITIDVEGAANVEAAKKIARSIANSPLVKTAVAGSDPNWGRIICAAGYAGVPFKPSDVDIYMQGLTVCKGGLAAKFSEAKLTKLLDQPDCHIRLVINGKGKAKARIWTCDFTEGYIKINGSYRT